MHIESVKLNGYSAFKFNRIHKFFMTTTSPVQVIIGTNGCGKSSLLRECNPRPAVRTSFEKDGLKQITITHLGSEYVITSDFTNTTSPHSFVKDGVELNVSGTTSVQNELVESHLGYTSLVHDLLNGKIQFANLAPGMRKNLLVSINPYDIDIVVDLNKKIGSHLRGLNSSIKLFHKRKAELLPKILDDVLLEQLTLDKCEIEENITQIDKWTFTINPHIDRLKQLLHDYEQYSGNLNNLQDYQNRLKQLYAQLQSVNITHISEETFSDDMLALTSEISGYKSTLENIESQLKTLGDEISRYEKLLEGSHTTETSALENRIQDIRDSLMCLTNSCTDKPMQVQAFSTWDLYNNRLSALLSDIGDFKGKLLSSDDLSKLDLDIIRYDSIIKSQANSAANLTQSMNNLLLQLEQLESVGDISSCKDHDCVLLPSYLKSLNTLQKQYDELHTRRVENERVIDETRIVLDNLSLQKSDADRYRPLLRKLKSMIDEYPYIRSCIGDRSMQEVLNSDPLFIHRQLSEWVLLSQNTYNRDKLSQELSILEERYKSALESNQTSSTMLEDLLAQRRSMREKLAITYTHTELRYQECILRKSSMEKYDSVKRKLVTLSDTVDNSLFFETLRHAIEHYECVLKGLAHARSVFLEKLGTISITINDQDRLKARYQEEVVDSITKLEAEYKHYQLLEKATSPNTGIPHQYMVAVLNTLIANINYFIKLVFNYKFEIELLPHDKPIDYKFSAIVGDDEVVVPDISECSSAQQDIINLAFMLSTIIQLKLTEYPIYLDEVGRTFDEHHKQQLLIFLKDLVDNGTISQLFLVNHHAVMYEGLQNSEVLVLDDSNIVVPTVYNDHVVIEK